MYENEFRSLKPGDIIFTESEYYTEWFIGVQLKVVKPLVDSGLLYVKLLEGERRGASIPINVRNSNKFILLKRNTVGLRGV